MRLKEFHAYENEDGTYRIAGITTVLHDEKSYDTLVSMDRVAITLTPLPNIEKQLMKIEVLDGKESI